MDLLATLGLSLIGGGFLVGLVRGWQQTTDSRRRAAEQAEFERRKRVKEALGIVEDLSLKFPHAREALRAQLDRCGDTEEAVRTALQQVPGVLLGQTSVVLGGRRMSVPVRWADFERGKPAYVVGRTGTGKTTAMLHAIKADIDAGYGVGVIAPDSELFTETLLPLCERRANDVIYDAPGDPACTVHLSSFAVEPGDDRARCGSDVYEILHRVVAHDGFGARMGPTLANSLQALVWWPGATLWDIRRLLADSDFRREVLASVRDPYVLDFWRVVYPSYPKGSATPLANRLDEVLRSPALRRALSQADGYSMRQVLATSRIWFVDLGRLDGRSMSIIGQMRIARFQLELLRRETQATTERLAFRLYVDEFQEFAPSAETTWRELCSRGRKYGLGLTLANQHPSQIQPAVRDDILGNAGSLIAFSLGVKDAEVLRKELLYSPGNGEPVRPVPLEALVDQSVGHAVAKLGSGAHAFKLRVEPPLSVPSADVGARVKAASWESYGTRVAEPVAWNAIAGAGRAALTPCAVDGLNEIELRLVTIVVRNPDRPSAEYARLLGLNGTRAVQVRKRLVERGYLRERKLSLKGHGKPALILEPLEPARQAVAAAEATRR